MFRRLLFTPYLAAGLFMLLLVLWFFVLSFSTGGWFTSTASYFILFSTEANGVAVIDQHWPFKLIQPQWLSGVSDSFDLLFRWSQAELLARLTLLFGSAALLAYFSTRALKHLISIFSRC